MALKQPKTIAGKQNTTDSNSPYFNKSLVFINKLEGFKTVFKNLHWSAPQMTYHKEIDDLLDGLIEFQDLIAETSQGYCDRQYKPGDIAGTAFEYSDGISALNELNRLVSSFYASIKDNNDLAGIVNVVNDFQTSLLKFKYLFRLASKD